MRAHVFDPYEFAVRAIAVCALECKSDLSAPEWVTDWALPLTDLVGLATGRAEHVSTVTVANVLLSIETKRDHVDGAVFGPRIHQDPEWATRLEDDRGLPIVPLFTLDDAPPLAELVAMCRVLGIDRTGLALLRVAHDPTLPEQVAYLLTAQAVEAIHRDAEREAQAERESTFREKRTGVLDAVRGAGLTEEFKFLRDQLPRRPIESLAARFRSLMSEPGYDAFREGWRASLEPLAELVQAHRPTADVHDAAAVLAETRNLLSHGVATPPSRPLQTATRILDVLARVELLRQLGFTSDQMQRAAERALRY